MRVLIGIAAGVILTALIGFISLSGSGSDMMFVDRVSSHSYEETVAKVKESFEANQWSVMAVKDSNAAFVKKGKGPIGKLTNMKVCKGSVAYKMLKNDPDKKFAAIMPCGVAIYEKEGKVMVSTMNLGLMKNMFDGEVRTLMEQVDNDISKIMQVL